MCLLVYVLSVIFFFFSFLGSLESLSAARTINCAKQRGKGLSGGRGCELTPKKGGGRLAVRIGHRVVGKHRHQRQV